MSTVGYINFILDVLSPLENVRARKMFSGYGIYKDSVFFALVLNDVLYFKVSVKDQSLYKKYGSEPFSYVKKSGHQVVMSYWQVPADIIENQTQLVVWAKRALDSARVSKAKTNS